MTAPQQTVHHIASKAGSSFYWPIRLMPPERRRAMMALYSFCRVADDAVDNAPSKEAAERAVAEWRQFVDDVYEGNAHTALATELQHAIQRYDLPRSLFDDIVAGLEMDTEASMLRPSLDRLTLYCYRVAGCVGLLSTRIFQCTHSKSESFAIALGHAMQLTNILRDIEEDAADGRLYLPNELLEKAGLKALTPQQIVQEREALRPVCQQLIQRADAYYGEAEAAITDEDRLHLAPALLMRDVYAKLLQKLKAKGGHTIGKGKLSLSTLEKATLLWNARRYRR